MKQIIKNYSFNKTAKTITFTDFGSIRLDRLQLVTNVTTHQLIYQFNEPTLGGSVAGNILTLDTDTSAMNNSDQLQIIYDCASGDPLYDSMSLSSAIQGNVSAGTADTGNPVKVGGKYNATPFSMSDGQRGDLQLDVHGNLNVNLATALVAEDATNNAFRVERAYTEQSSLAASALNDLLVPSTDVSSFASFSIQITGSFSGTLNAEISNDNSNWQVIYTMDAGTGTRSLSIGGTGLRYGQLAGRYFRIRMTAYGSGTANGKLALFTHPLFIDAIAAAQSGSWSLSLGTGTNNIGNVSVTATPSVSTVLVGTSSTSVLASNASRKSLAFSNVGANNIYLNLAGGTAVATNFLLAPNTSLVLDRFVPSTAITAIAATAATNLSVTELA